MPPERREQIERLVKRFEGQAITQDAINEYCKVNGIDPVVPRGELLDYKEQVDHDKIVGGLFPKILAELQNLAYVPEFASEKVRKDIETKNDEVRVNITKLFEEEGIKYRYVSNLSEELGNMVGNAVTSAGTTAFNKALAVMLRIAQDKFGGEFTMKHARDYSEKIIKEDIAKRDAKKSE